MNSKSISGTVIVIVVGCVVYYMNGQRINTDANAHQTSKSLTVMKRYCELEDRYEFGKIVGEGTFATVRVGLDRKSNEKVAIKEIRKELSDEQSLANEVSILNSFGVHENIIRLLDVCDSEKILYIVTDFADGGEVFDRIIEQGEMSEMAASKMMLEAVAATKHLHDNDIIHLDIKPENLLLMSVGKSKNSDVKIKLADFGLAIKLPGPEYHFVQTECVGTPAYWAPELIKNEPFGKPVDIWALGCVLYILLCGSHPFDPYGDASEGEILAKALKGEYDRDNAQFQQISPHGKDLISHMLDPNLDTRYVAAEVIKHPWLSNSEQILSTKPMSSNYISKLKAFRVLRIMSMGLVGIGGETVHQCTDMFKHFDKNKDDVLTRDELASALGKIGVSFDTKEMDELFKVFDPKNSEQITSDEFVSAVLRRRNNISKLGNSSEKSSEIQDDLEQIKLLFNTLDKNGDGYIEREDCIHLMDQLGNVNNRTKLFRNMQKYRTSKKGQKVDFAQFLRYYKELGKKRKGMGKTIHKPRNKTNREPVMFRKKDYKAQVD